MTDNLAKLIADSQNKLGYTEAVHELTRYTRAIVESRTLSSQTLDTLNEILTHMVARSSEKAKGSLER